MVSPKSARRAWRSLSMRMLDLVENRFRADQRMAFEEPYPFQIPVYHPLAMHI